jgi:2-dehydropantoate 2-reductase
MRILVVGAGALGGYFGGRLLEAGRDVTFLVRPRRAAQLANNGLVIRSTLGDLHIPSPPAVLSEQIGTPYDLILLSCKSYDLADAMESFAPAVGPSTAIIPVINGMRHIDLLIARFGRERVLGGLAIISATLDNDGTVLHLNDRKLLTYGELDGAATPRIDAIASMFAGVAIDANSTTTIRQELWEKWVFIASLAGLTALMRAQVGDIERAGGAELGMAIFAECCAIATANGFAPRGPALERGRPMLTTAGSTLAASMAMDIDRGARIEADAIIGDLLARRVGAANERTTQHAHQRSLLDVVYIHLKSYEARRARESA